MAKLLLSPVATSPPEEERPDAAGTTSDLVQSRGEITHISITHARVTTSKAVAAWAC